MTFLNLTLQLGFFVLGFRNLNQYIFSWQVTHCLLSPSIQTDHGLNINWQDNYTAYSKLWNDKFKLFIVVVVVIGCLLSNIYISILCKISLYVLVYQIIHNRPQLWTTHKITSNRINWFKLSPFEIKPWSFFSERNKHVTWYTERYLTEKISSFKDFICLISF